MSYELMGQKIKNIREANGLTQEQLADEVSCSANSIGRIERGEMKPRLDLFLKISSALKTTPDFLLQDFYDYTLSSVGSNGIIEHETKMKNMKNAKDLAKKIVELLESQD